MRLCDLKVDDCFEILEETISGLPQRNFLLSVDHIRRKRYKTSDWLKVGDICKVRSAWEDSNGNKEVSVLNFSSGMKLRFNATTQEIIKTEDAFIIKTLPFQNPVKKVPDPLYTNQCLELAFCEIERLKLAAKNFLKTFDNPLKF